MRTLTVLAGFLLLASHGLGAVDQYLPRTATPPGVCFDDTTLMFEAGAEKFQQRPAVVYGGGNYFTVWEDSRHDGFTRFVIYGGRMSTDGKMLDSVGIRLSEVDRNGEHWPGVAFDGTNYLAVWQGVNPATSSQDLYGARVTPDGEVLDPGGFLICSGAGHQIYGCAAFGDSNYLVVWSDSRDIGDIYCSRVTPGGVVLDPGGNHVMRRDFQRNPSGIDVCASADGWLVVADDCWGLTIAFAHVKRDGMVALVDTLEYRTSDSRWFPDVDYSPEDSLYLVAWQDWRSGPPPEGNGVYAARIALDGTVLDSGGFRVADDPARYQGIPAVSYNGRHFLVAFTEYVGTQTYYDVSARRIGPDGVLVDSVSLPMSSSPTSESWAAVDNNGHDWFVAWDDSRGNYDAAWGPDVYGSRVDSSGAALDVYPDDLIVATAAPRQFKSTAAVGDGEYLAVWQEYRGKTSWDIYAARYDANGTMVGQPFGVDISEHVTTDPVAAAGDSCYLVAWYDPSFPTGIGWIRGRRVGLDGTPLDTAFTVSDGYINRYPAVEFDGAGFMVAFWEGLFPYEIRARKVGQDGTMEPEFVVADVGWRGSPGWNLHTSVDLAFDGTNYLTVWPDWQTDASQFEIKGCRFTSGGTVLDSNGFYVTRTGFVDEDFPRVTFGDDGYFVVWHTDDTERIGGARVDTSGVSLDSLGITISSAGETRAHPQVTYDGLNYVAVWEEGLFDIGDIYYARVTPGGTVLDPNGRSLATQEHRQSYPNAVSGQTGVTFVPYSSFIDTVYGASRLHAVAMTSSGASGPAGRLPGSRIGRANPNPFSRATALQYSQPLAGDVRFDVLDVSGRVVRGLESGSRSAGHHTVSWNGRDDRGRRMPAGVYFIRGSVGESETTQGVILTR